jgi:hypothetical protein
MLYECRNAPFKGWADGITGSSEVNSASRACELPGLEAQAINVRKQTIFLFAKLLLRRRVIDARRVRDDEASD